MAYFYFDFRDTDKQDRRNLLLSLLSQLSSRSDLCCDVLHRVYVAHDKGTRKPTDDVLLQCLKETLTFSNDRPVYIILDAVDECPNTFGVPSPRDLVLGLVKELVELILPNLRICVTSRPEIDIRSALEPLTPLQVSLHDETGQKKDIVEYITRIRTWSSRRSLTKLMGCKYPIAMGTSFSLILSQVPMGFLPTRSSTTLFPAQPATYSSGTPRISRRHIRAHIEEYQQGNPNLCPSSFAMPHSGSPSSPPRRACGSTRV